MEDAIEIDVIPLLAWSRIWSPLVPNEQRLEAWQVLNLPDTFEQHETDYWSTFHTGHPAPKVPMLFHAVLGADGAAVREDWMRVAQHLGLKSNENRLPPDHLGSCCEILAYALRRRESVLVAELCNRFFMPWCQRARALLDGPQDQAMIGLCDQFQTDLEITVAGLKTAA